MVALPFTVLNLTNLLPDKFEGDSGHAEWQTLELDGLRIRIVSYSKGYVADHWCQKGHLVFCLEGEFQTQLEDGTSYTLTKNQGYIVTDGMSSHRSLSDQGVKLLVVDGDFLKSQNEGQ